MLTSYVVYSQLQQTRLASPAGANAAQKPAVFAPGSKSAAPLVTVPPQLSSGPSNHGRYIPSSPKPANVLALPPSPARPAATNVSVPRDAKRTEPPLPATKPRS
jgi:hypothetical protein